MGITEGTRKAEDMSTLSVAKHLLLVFPKTRPSPSLLSEIWSMVHLSEISPTSLSTPTTFSQKSTRNSTTLFPLPFISGWSETDQGLKRRTEPHHRGSTLDHSKINNKRSKFSVCDLVFLIIEIFFLISKYFCNFISEEI